jgi:hypothetical protein
VWGWVIQEISAVELDSGGCSSNESYAQPEPACHDR